MKNTISISELADDVPVILINMGDGDGSYLRSVIDTCDCVKDIKDEYEYCVEEYDEKLSFEKWFELYLKGCNDVSDDANVVVALIEGKMVHVVV